jgi:hypothetical protein
MAEKRTKADRAVRKKSKSGSTLSPGNPGALPVHFLQPSKRLLNFPHASIGHGHGHWRNIFSLRQFSQTFNPELPRALVLISIVNSRIVPCVFRISA